MFRTCGTSDDREKTHMVTKAVRRLRVAFVVYGNVVLADENIISGNNWKHFFCLTNIAGSITVTTRYIALFAGPILRVFDGTVSFRGILFFFNRFGDC